MIVGSCLLTARPSSCTSQACSTCHQQHNAADVAGSLVGLWELSCTLARSAVFQIITQSSALSHRQGAQEEPDSRSMHEQEQAVAHLRPPCRCGSCDAVVKTACRMGTVI
eukprot:jgi/Ulvmu1/6831/UM031_0035.1